DDVFITNVVLNVNPAEYDPLQGRIHRGNLKRTGVLYTPGATNVSGVKWSFQTGSNVMSSPVVVNGIVYVGSDNGRFYALDAETGTQIWQFVTSPVKPVRCGPCIADGAVYFTAESVLYALDAAVGTQIWRYTRGSAYALDNSPAVAYGAVFAGFEKWSGTAAISGIDTASGKEVWRFRAMDYPNNGPQGPAIDETTLYTSGDDNVTLAADLRSELQKWRGGGHHCQACVAVDDDSVYYIGQATLRAINKNTVATRWMFAGTVSGDQTPRSSPALHNNVVYIGHQDTWFYAVNANNGSLKWKYKTGGEIWSSPTVAGNAVFVGGLDGWVYAFDLNGSGTDGVVLWKHQTGGPVRSTPWVDNGVVFIGSDDGNVYAIYSPVPEPVGGAAALAALFVIRAVVRR
ncbi:PQQ-like beta-propeller repeat protein, partial [bacterium]|nr:PQQ-like beta-propeller repeat protein [bacterium]